MGHSSNDKGKIISFLDKDKAEKDVLNSSGWDYRGERERVDRLIENANNAKTVNAINRAALALMKEDEHITTLLNNVKQDDGDARALMTLRRKIREQRRRTKL